MFKSTPKAVSSILATFTATIDALLAAEVAHTAIADKKAEEAHAALALSHASRAEGIRAGSVALRFQKLIAEETV